MNDAERLSGLWYEQGMTGLMAVVGTKLQRDLGRSSPISLRLENCVTGVQNSVQYANCLVPLIRQKRILDQWRRTVRYRQNVKQMRRRLRCRRDTSFFGSSGSMTQQASEATPAGGSILSDVTDWLTNAVRFVKENNSAKVKYSPKKISTTSFESDNQAVRADSVAESPVDSFVKHLFAPVFFGNKSEAESTEWTSSYVCKSLYFFFWSTYVFKQGYQKSLF